LPTSLTKSSHMLLDADATKVDDTVFENDHMNDQEPHESQMITNPLPVRQTEARHIYSLQKQLEETFAHYRTMAFLTTDVSALSNVLQKCNEVSRILTSAVVMSEQNCNVPPVFKAITEEFKQTRKTFHCVSGMKRKSSCLNSKTKKTETR